MDLFKRDEPFENDIAAPAAWNDYLLTALKFILIFSFATLLMEEYIFFAHHGQTWAIADYALGALYLLVVVLSLAQMIAKLPMAAILLAAPTIPLFMLLLILGILPVLHVLHKQPLSPSAAHFSLLKKGN